MCPIVGFFCQGTCAQKCWTLLVNSLFVSVVCSGSVRLTCGCSFIVQGLLLIQSHETWNSTHWLRYYATTTIIAPSPTIIVIVLFIIVVVLNSTASPFVVVCVVSISLTTYLLRCGQSDMGLWRDILNQDAQEGGMLGPW